MSYEIIQKFISNNRSRKQLNAVGSVVHETATPNASDENEYSYFNNAYRGASAHAFVDCDSISQLIPWDEQAWHAGGTANRTRIGIELCHYDDETRFNEVWKRAVWLFAWVHVNIIKQTTINNDNLMSHAEVSNKWHETNHQDPISYFRQFGKTVDDFRKAVQNEINNMIGISQSQPISSSNNSQPQENPIEKARKFVGQRCKELQEKLIKCGYNCGGYGADGDFGQGTYNSLMAFQKDNGLVVDGLAGDKTFEKLDSIISEMNKPKIQTNQNVLEYQRAFNKMGLGRLDEDGILGNLTLGSVSKLSLLKVGSNNAMVGWVQGVIGCTQDNKYGNITKSKVISYQQNHGLSADGIVGQQTIKNMLTN